MARRVSLPIAPRRGEVWLADLNPTQGRELSGTRPVLVISSDGLNLGPAGLVVVLPITSTDRGIASHIPVSAGDGGLRKASVVRTDQIRTISRKRLGKKVGTLSPEAIRKTELVMRRLLDLR